MGALPLAADAARASTALAESLGVSEQTVRRDLRKLEAAAVLATPRHQLRSASNGITTSGDSVIAKPDHRPEPTR